MDLEAKSRIFRLLSSTFCLWHFNKTSVKNFITIKKVRHSEGWKKYAIVRDSPFKISAMSAGKFRRYRKWEKVGGEEFRKDPGGTKFSDVAVFVVRPFVPVRWKCWPVTKLRNSRESVAEGRVGGSLKEQNREEKRDRKTRWGRRQGVWIPWRIWRVCARGCWMDRRQSEVTWCICMLLPGQRDGPNYHKHAR